MAAHDARRYALAPASERVRRQQAWWRRLQYPLAVTAMGLLLLIGWLGILAFGMVAGMVLGIDPSAGITR